MPHDVSPRPPPFAGVDLSALPPLLTPDEVAGLLRKSLKAVYAMSERGLLPGVIRRRSRLLFDRDVVLGWLNEGRAPSTGRTGR